MLDLDNLTNNNNTDIDDDLSLESILAEYADFDEEKAASRETEARSRQIVYEALGETEFSGGIDSREAEDTVDAYYAEPEPSPEPERDYYRTAMSYSNRLRRSFERFGSRINVPGNYQTVFVRAYRFSQEVNNLIKHGNFRFQLDR